MAEAPARPSRPPRACDPSVPSPPMTGEESQWEVFNKLHDHCYLVTDNAISAEMDGKLSLAIDGYQKALDLMDKALAVEAGDNEKIVTMQEKIRRAKKETLTRVVDAQTALAATVAAPVPPAAVAADPPPSYASLYPEVPTESGPIYPAVPEETSVRPQLAERVKAAAETDQAAALMEIAEATDDGCVQLPQQAEQLFSLPAGAQMFFVAPDGAVSAPSAAQELRVCRFSAGAVPAGSPKAFLQCGDWTYPLIPGCSPVLHSHFGPYMFPDLERPGCHVALLLPEAVAPSVRRQFEELLTSLTALVQQPSGAPAEAAAAAAPTAEQKERLAAVLSGGLVKGADMLSKGLLAAADKLSQYITTGTHQLQSNMAPAQTPVKVDPRIQSGAETAKKVSTGVLKVSEYVVGQVGRGTMTLAGYIAPHVKRTGTKLMTKAHITDEKSAGGKMDDVLEVASGAVRGFGVVYTGLERAASLLATSLSNNTVQLVEHRYGAEAGRVAEHSLHSAGNVALTGHNVQSLGAKGLAKKVAKDTGKHIIQEHEQKKQGPAPPRPPPPV